MARSAKCQSHQTPTTRVSMLWTPVIEKEIRIRLHLDHRSSRQPFCQSQRTKSTSSSWMEKLLKKKISTGYHDNSMACEFISWASVG